ncbi:MAG: type VI secretion system baseplate subunit TssK [Alphaproteobacteria bacterium]|nr:MAG: type VI secretion system baseplate subunit TssK [Alphaproteobacteria bacterium]
MGHKFNISPAIGWHEGMMLAPHHFEQQDLRHKQTLATKFKLLTPYAYGVSNIEIDDVALSKDIFTIKEVDAIFPDGEMVSIKNSIEISLKEFSTHAKSHQTVWMGIVPFNKDVSPLNKETPRYQVQDTEPVASFEDQSNLLPISRLIPVVTLYVAAHPNPRFVSIPVAKLECKRDVFTRLPFTLPCFAIEDSESFLMNIRKLIVLCRTKEKFLMKKYEKVIGTKKEPYVSLVLTKIKEILPLMEMLLGHSHMHPFQGYQVLCDIVGRLSPLQMLKPAFNVPPYKHDDIDYAFGHLFSKIQEEFEAIEETYKYIQLDENENVFSVHIDETKNKLLLSVTFKEEVDTKTDWVNNTIIVSDSMLDTAISERITGAKRRILKVSEYPDDLFDVGDLLVEIEIDEKYVFNNKKLILFNPIDKELPESIFWCVKHVD